MTDPTFTDVHSNEGGSAVVSVAQVCCPCREGQGAPSGSFSRMFQQYGRSTSWFTSDESIKANLPGGVTWEDFYYKNTYAYHLAYKTAASSRPGASGTIYVNLRANATVHKTPETLTNAAPGLFKTVTPERITKAFVSWKKAIRRHWTNRRYTVWLGAPECAGSFVMHFSVSQVSTGSPHVTFSVLNMANPETKPEWAKALANPESPRHATAQQLFEEWRSNAGKFNLGDNRGALVFAHEYGHWMGWGDEYIEQSETMPNPINPSGDDVLVETRGSNNVSVRVAIRIQNPTLRYRSVHGTSQQDIDITVPRVRDGLMAKMGEPPRYPVRYVFTIVDDFITMYNQNHYGGSTSAYCINVTSNPVRQRRRRSRRRRRSVRRR